MAELDGGSVDFGEGVVGQVFDVEAGDVEVCFFGLVGDGVLGDGFAEGLFAGLEGGLVCIGNKDFQVLGIRLDLGGKQSGEKPQ